MSHAHINKVITPAGEIRRVENKKPGAFTPGPHRSTALCNPSSGQHGYSESRGCADQRDDDGGNWLTHGEPPCGITAAPLLANTSIAPRSGPCNLRQVGPA